MEYFENYDDEVIEMLEPDVGEPDPGNDPEEPTPDDCGDDGKPVSPTSAAVISYGGKDIKALAAGKTGTVRCKGKRMKTDLVVKAADIAAPKLQEKTADKNGEYLPDEGYVGFSKFKVNVAGSGGGGATTIISDLHTITIEKAAVTEDGNNTITIGG